VIGRYEAEKYTKTDLLSCHPPFFFPHTEERRRRITAECSVRLDHRSNSANLFTLIVTCLTSQRTALSSPHKRCLQNFCRNEWWL